MMPEMSDGDSFICSECGAAVWSYPHTSPRPTMCANCWFIEQLVEDPGEREELRRRTGIGNRWIKPRTFVAVDALAGNLYTGALRGKIDGGG